MNVNEVSTTYLSRRGTNASYCTRVFFGLLCSLLTRGERAMTANLPFENIIVIIILYFFIDLFIIINSATYFIA
jgi:hypothetical protein